jgi:uncharacterized protein (TIGR02001 family)
MKKLALCAFVLFVASTHVAFSAEAPAPAWDFAFGAKIMSDYNLRGISQSARTPSYNGYGELSYDWFYTGVAYYKTDLPNDPVGEVDLYGGIRKTFGSIGTDIGAVYYYYPDSKQLFDGATPITPKNIDFYEIYAHVTWDAMDKLKFGGNIFYSPNWGNTGSPGTYGSLTGKLTLIDDLSASTEIGHYWLGTATRPGPPLALVDYNYWNIGLTYAVNDAVSLDLRYHNTDLNKAQCFTDTGDPDGISTGKSPGFSSWCGSAVIATVSIDLLWSKVAHK